MKYLFIVLMLFAVPAYSFDLSMDLSVEGRVKSGFISRQINVLPDNAGRNLHQYGYTVNSPNGFTNINHEFVGSPMSSNLQVTLVPDAPSTSKFKERVLYRMEGLDVNEFATRRVSMNVDYAEIASSIDFASGDRSFEAMGEGRFLMQGVGVHIDPILCEVTAFKVEGRGLFNFADDDDVVPDTYDDPLPPSFTTKSRFCPWIDRAGGAQPAFG